jgi:hypothetical protein
MSVVTVVLGSSANFRSYFIDTDTIGGPSQDNAERFLSLMCDHCGQLKLYWKTSFDVTSEDFNMADGWKVIQAAQEIVDACI